MGREVALRIKQAKDSLNTPFFWEQTPQKALDWTHYYRRRLLREPIPVRLSARAEEQAVREAAAIGLDERTRIVTVHAREAGYKFGREVQDAKPNSVRDDSTRNVRIESYFAAIDHLVERGYTVVRMGDPTMTPVKLCAN